MNIILLGPPGSGKGTQAATVVEHLKLVHIAPGDILRKEKEKESVLGQRVAKYMELGNFIPDTLINDIMHDYLTTTKHPNGMLLDGYPRDLEQAQALDAVMDELHEGIQKVIYLRVSDQTIVKRLSGRRVNLQTGATYHVEHNPPPEGEEVTQREDDKPAAVQHRLDEYHEKTEPLIAHYKSKGILVEVDGEQSIEDIHDQVLGLLND